MLHDTQKLPDQIAAIDLGSNSFHMLVARAGDGEPVIVDRLREMVQLALGLDESRRLTQPACERAIACLERFGQRVRDMPADCVRAVGTNTFRSAHNALEFLEQAEQALGHTIETISGIEEARLIYLGVTQALPDPDVRRLVVDIGGGSTELIAGKGMRPSAMESLYMGCVTVSRAHFCDGVLDSKRWRRAELAALQELEPVRARFGEFEWQEAVGASGTVRAVESLVRGFGWSDRGITPSSLKKLREQLLKAGRVDALKLEGINPRRRSILAGGVVVLSAVFEALAIEHMRRSDGALREGLLYDLVGRIRKDDVRGRSVEALAARYHVDLQQAARVESTALRLLAGVADNWPLDSLGASQFLTWAAWLHEIGLDIAHDHYHRHGQYIVANSDLMGFSRSEQLLLAMLVRAHRRKFPAAAIRELRRNGRKQIDRLAILLRLAVLLHRSRSPKELPQPELNVSKKTLQLSFPEGWLDGHPLTRADLETEATYLGAAGYKLKFS